MTINFNEKHSKGTHHMTKAKISSNYFLIKKIHCQIKQSALDIFSEKLRFFFCYF